MAMVPASIQRDILFNFCVIFDLGNMLASSEIHDVLSHFVRIISKFNFQLFSEISGKKSEIDAVDCGFGKKSVW